MKEMSLPLSDKELVLAARSGDEQAFQKLYEKYWQDLYKVASRRLLSEEDVKDVLQDTFISLWKNINTISVDDNIGGYLYTSLRNKIFNFYGRNQVRLRTLLSQSFQPVEAEEIIFSSLNTKELKIVIEKIIAGMPPKMREIYLLSKEQQLTHAQIANLLLLAPQTVKNQVHGAVARLRAGLQKIASFCFIYLLFLF